MNKLTDGSNLIWEASRMILPEHKEALNRHRYEVKRGGKRSKPELDPQELEIINEHIARSLNEREPVRLKLYDPFEECIVEGIVEQVDPVLRRVRVDGEWFKMEDITGVG